MATTKYIVNNLSGQTITNEPILRPYKVYTALLTQYGDGTNTQTTGPLIIGARYIITTYEIGDDFTSVANVISGDINTDGCEFIAIGTTPDNYLNGSTLTDTAAPVATVLENNLGFDIQWIYNTSGSYYANLTSDINKTFTTIATPSFSLFSVNRVSSINFDDDYVYIMTAINNAKSDGLLYNNAVEIRVYN